MMTADDAYNKHIEMWTAMQKELGDNPSFGQRCAFKMLWCAERGEDIKCNCYLCQYDMEQYGGDVSSRICGDRCLVDWGAICDGSRRYVGCCNGKTRYGEAPISEILNLPRRKEINDDC